ncbi:MAG: phosphate acetyltransferase, partial [candidate division Zixibacteria bacterium]|nr:phosphate acetyltransferase [candidate division Zixibacteria bacterium]
MSALDKIKEKAKAAKRRVVLPEGTEPRSVEAAATIIADQMASVTLLGNEQEIAALAKQHQLDLDTVEVIDPATSPSFDQYVSEFMEIRKTKGITEEAARETMANSL